MLGVVVQDGLQTYDAGVGSGRMEGSLKQLQVNKVSEDSVYSYKKEPV